MKINYIIPTFAGYKKVNPKRINYEYILYDHLRVLLNIIKRNKKNKIIDQITIMKASVPSHLNLYKNFYNIQSYVTQIERKGIKVKIHNVPNHHSKVSYHQYINAFKLYPEFDYYILCEDDYIPHSNTFVSELVYHFKRKIRKGGGFLCTYAPKKGKHAPNGGFKGSVFHSSISNGIIDNIAVKKLIETYNVNAPMIGQLYFSHLLIKSKMKIEDYSDYGQTYSIPFWTNKTIIYYDEYNSGKNKYIFIPIQMLKE